MSGPIAAGVVLEMGAVGGADLDQPGAGAGHDVGHAEGAADLDQLAARDDRLAAVRPALFSASSTAAALLLTTVASSAPVSSQRRSRTMVVALAAPAARRGRTPARRRWRMAVDGGLDRRLGEQRAAEVGVQHRAGQVEDRRAGWAGRGVEAAAAAAAIGLGVRVVRPARRRRERRPARCAAPRRRSAGGRGASMAARRRRRCAAPRRRRAGGAGRLSAPSRPPQ